MSEWISVKDRLPPDEEDVLMCIEFETRRDNGKMFKSLGVEVGYYLEGKFHVYAGRKRKVLYWMEIPPIPDEVRGKEVE